MTATRTRGSAAGSRVRAAPPALYSEKLVALLAAADEEFVPPLSSRTSTLQSALGPAKARQAGIDTYLAAMLDQELLVAHDGADVLGFLSYRPDHVVTVEGRDPIGPVAYVTTIIVAPAARGRGVARSLYQALLAHPGRPVATRTWSANGAHLALLASLGFSQVITLPDDRGPGIDTVYLLLE